MNIKLIESILASEIECEAYEKHVVPALEIVKKALANDALDRMSENERELGIQMQPEPEPVAWTDIDFTNIYISEMVAKEKSADVPLYKSQPKREWQGLTDEEIDELQSGLSASHTDVQAIEAKLKEKNHDPR